MSGAFAASPLIVDCLVASTDRTAPPSRRVSTPAGVTTMTCPISPRLVSTYADVMPSPPGWRDDADPDKVILAVGKCLASDAMDSDMWTELSLRTGTRDIVNSHPRLLRSKAWGDPDHQEHVWWVTPRMLGEAEKGRRPRGDLAARFPNLGLISDFAGVRGWVAENDPVLFADVCTQDGPGDATMPDGTVLDAAEQAAARLDVREMRSQIDRIRRDFSGDPEAAIGQSKELVETVTKTILGLTGDSPSTKEDVPGLVKQTLVHLGLDPAKVPEGEDPTEARALRRVLGGLSAILSGAAELRNARGTGHGRSGVPIVDDALARLSVGLVLPAVIYLVEVYERSAAAGPAPKLVAVGPKEPATGGLRISVGDRVEHSAFGLGTVLDVAGAGDAMQATVDFGSGGHKRLVVRYAPLRVV